MSTFKDSRGKEYILTFDAFNLDSIRQKTGIDLVDSKGLGLAKIEADDVAVVKVIAAALELQLKEFASVMTGEAIEAGRAAIEAAAANFTPRRRWSEIQRSLPNSRKMIAMSAMKDDIGPMTEALPLLDAFSRLSPEVQASLIRARGDTSLLESEDNESAPGPEETPSRNAIDAPESAELPPAA